MQEESQKKFWRNVKWVPAPRVSKVKYPCRYLLYFGLKFCNYCVFFEHMVCYIFSNQESCFGTKLGTEYFDVAGNAEI